MTLFTGEFRRANLACLALIPILALAACSGQDSTLTAPSATGGSTSAKPAPTATPDKTVLSFENYASATQTVDVKTLTTSALNPTLIDAGTIKIQVWVDTNGKPSSFVPETGQWVNITGNGDGLVSALTSRSVDLDNLASLSSSDAITVDASCGDTISFRAHYVTGGGAVKVGTHFSSPDDVTLTGCVVVCTVTYGQGYWKNHLAAWPVANLTLGTREYTKVELSSILQLSVGGNPQEANALVQIAHQLIAAKLNIANGAAAPQNPTLIASADALIGSSIVPPVVGSGFLQTGSETGAIVEALTAYNESCKPKAN